MRLGNALRAGILFLLLTTGFAASSLVFASPAEALLPAGDGDADCATHDTSQISAAALALACDSKTVTPPDSSCTQVQNGFRTCAVRSLGNGFEFLALAMAIAGIFVSCILWAMGSKGQNPGQELTGKRGIILCITAAFVIGAYPHFTEYLNSRATQIDGTGVTNTPPPTVKVGP